jgi:hypothetical protein
VVVVVIARVVACAVDAKVVAEVAWVVAVEAGGRLLLLLEGSRLQGLAFLLGVRLLGVCLHPNRALLFCSKVGGVVRGVYLKHIVSG